MLSVLQSSNAKALTGGGHVLLDVRAPLRARQDVFNDPVLATAILDWLQYHATMLTIYGGTLSTAGKKEGQALRQSTGCRILEGTTDVAS